MSAPTAVKARMEAIPKYLPRPDAIPNSTVQEDQDFLRAPTKSENEIITS